ncbi:MAG TPA: SIMPL domain-containing protein [Chitinophagaceae bacterium]
MHQIRYPDKNIEISFPTGKNLLISVKGMANVKADAYVAIFNVTQTGKTAEEVNALMDNRINQSLEQIRKKANTEVLVDMVSFVPIYEYEVEKKIFSKKTYNEVPAGFELKKNIHIKYTNPNDLHGILTILTASEIYDLVRVDYFSNNLEVIKKELMTKAVAMLQEKLKIHQTLLGLKLDTLDKLITDGYKAVLPVEMYKSYQAYNSSSLNTRKAATVNQADKSTTLYYQPVIDKEFDFVINPTIFEPVIQVMYEIKLSADLGKEKVPNTQKEYILVTPSGDLKNINPVSIR